jgi:hypothetical protein
VSDSATVAAVPAAPGGQPCGRQIVRLGPPRPGTPPSPPPPPPPPLFHPTRSLAAGWTAAAAPADRS